MCLWLTAFVRCLAQYKLYCIKLVYCIVPFQQEGLQGLFQEDTEENERNRWHLGFSLEDCIRTERDFTPMAPCIVLYCTLLQHKVKLLHVQKSGDTRPSQHYPLFFHHRWITKGKNQTQLGIIPHNCAYQMKAR